MAVASYSGVPEERVRPVERRRKNGARLAAAWVMAGLGLIALAVLEHERNRAQMGQHSALCGTLFTCADQLIKDNHGSFGDRHVPVKKTALQLQEDGSVSGIDKPVDPESAEETGIDKPAEHSDDSQSIFSFGGEARDSPRDPHDVRR